MAIYRAAAPPIRRAMLNESVVPRMSIFHMFRNSALAARCTRLIRTVSFRHMRASPMPRSTEVAP